MTALSVWNWEEKTSLLWQFRRIKELRWAKSSLRRAMLRSMTKPGIQYIRWYAGDSVGIVIEKSLRPGGKGLPVRAAQGAVSSYRYLLSIL